MADNLNDGFNKALNNLKANAKIQAEINSGMGGYLEKVKELGQLTNSLVHAEKEINNLIQKNKQIKEQINQLSKLNTSAALKEKKELENKKKINEKIIALSQKELGILKEQTEEFREQVQNANKIAIAFNTIGAGAKKLPGLLKAGFGKLHSWGLFEMDKQFRMTAVSMNMGNKQMQQMTRRMGELSTQTWSYGAGAKDIAKMQEGYADELGRTVAFGNEGAEAMVLMARGTSLGFEGAVAMVSEMDKFGLSATGAKDVIQDAVTVSAKMGVNGNKAVKELQKNLKFAQRFTFKGGVKGLARMSADATRLKLDMDGIAGLAEKVFRPEGAIEMAAQLATMGGEFAKLGDPMQLMFKARNDFAGFAKDIGKATVEFIDFNSETGEFSTKGGLALDRMRELSKITGISVEKLQEMGQAQKRIETISGQLRSPFQFNNEDKELIGSMAKFQKGKGWTIEVDGVERPIKDLNSGMLKSIRDNATSLEKRAELSRTFDDDLKQVIEMLKEQLVPFVQALKNNMDGPIKDFIKKLTEEDFFGKIQKFAKTAGDIVGKIGGFLAKMGSVFGEKGVFAALIGGLILDKAKWFINGAQLAAGFNSMAKVSGGSGGFGGSGVKGKKVGKGGFLGGYNSSRKMGGTRYQAMKSGGRNMMRGVSKGAKVGGKMMGKSLLKKIPIVGLLAGLGFGIDRAIDGDWLGALGEVGSGAASLIPGAGTAASMGIDAMLAAKDMNTTEADDAIIKFNPQDKFMSVDDATMIAGTNVNGNKDLAKAITSKNSMNHTFDEIKISINVDSQLQGLGKIGEDLVNNRKFIQELNTRIQEEIRMVIGGGKLNPNPI
jgi:hypothetical protein